MPYFGLGMLLHIAGSAAFDVRSILPALLSGLICALFTNYAPIQQWLAERIPSGTVVFSGLQFLISLCLVMRTRIAVMRFRNAHEAYGRFHFALLRLAILLSSNIDRSPNIEKNAKALDQYRGTIMRWIRAVQVLALEEFRGHTSPEYRLGILTFTEEIQLFSENRPAARVLRWMIRGYHKYLPLTAIPFGGDARTRNLLDEVFLTYHLTMLQTNQVYFFPFAQLAWMCVFTYGLYIPLAFAVMMPQSNALGPIVCFFSVWVTFAFNLTGHILEWPFGGQENDLPLAYFTMRFMEEMSEIEFNPHPTALSHTLEKLLGEYDFGGADYVVPVDRPIQDTNLRNTKTWVQQTLHELDLGAETRRRIRQNSNTIATTTNTKKQPFISEIRARGQVKVLY